MSDYLERQGLTQSWVSTPASEKVSLLELKLHERLSLLGEEKKEISRLFL